MVKLHEYGPLIGVPEAVLRPRHVAVYVVPAASGLDGVNVATVSAPLKPTDPPPLLPPESFTVNDTVVDRLRERGVGSVTPGYPTTHHRASPADTTGGVGGCVVSKTTSTE